MTQYVSISEVQLYEAADGTGDNLALGATATSSGEYTAGREASKAIDGNTSGTFWESKEFNSITASVWLQLSFDSPVAVRSLRMYGGYQFERETPKDFTVMASNDLVEWATLADISGWGGFVDGTTPRTIVGLLRFDLLVSGLSVLDNGSPSSAIIVSEYSTGKLVSKVTPAASGQYSFRPQNLTPLLITHIGPTGYAPQCDGPITPQEL